MIITQVQNYIKRGRQALSLDIFERVADGLHIPGRMLGMTRRPWEGQLADNKPDGTVSDATTPVTPDGRSAADAK
jgi:hypothetical protein